MEVYNTALLCISATTNFWCLAAANCSERLTKQGVKSVFLVFLCKIPLRCITWGMLICRLLQGEKFHFLATRANALARGTFLFWSDSRLLQNALNVFLGVMWSPEKFWLKRYRWDPLLVIFWLVPVVKHACRNWSSPAMRSCQLVSQALGEGLKMAGTSRR